MPNSPKRLATKPSRIHIARDGRAFAITIEGGIALIIAGLVAGAYFVHLFH